jgi:REP element-mobilizing transposase RayT
MPYDPDFKDDHTPLAYIISFRSFGTWLHGDRRGSVDRFHNVYGSPRLGPEHTREIYERSIMTRPPVRLNAKQRAAAERGIRETCKFRKWTLWALNVRTNHVHVVVTANCSSKQARAALKANATRAMRESKCWNGNKSPWARRGSRRKLFTEKQLNAAIDYVLYDQGEPLPEDDDGD